MLSEAQIKRVWEGMLGAEIRASYFAELVERANKEQRLLTWATLLMSSGAVGAALVQLSPDYSFLRIVLPVGAGGASLFSLARANPKRAIDAADLHMRWSRLALEYEKLWENVYADDAASKLDTLSGQAIEVSKASTSFPNEPGRMRKWEHHVIHHRLPVRA